MSIPTKFVFSLSIATACGLIALHALFADLTNAQSISPLPLQATSHPTASPFPSPTAVTLVRSDFERYFKAFDVIGAFVLYDLKANQYIHYNPERCTQRFIPASTFKIFNTLVGLETGVITGEDFTLKWDGTPSPIPSWNRDQMLPSAFQNSVVWYYQEVARRVGRERMQHYIDAAGYGTQNISGNLDSFWLDGALRISPTEQIDLLVRLYKDDLPFSLRSMTIVKKIMVLETTSAYTLRGKVGWGQRFKPQIGWFVGYLETNGKAYFFATNIESATPDGKFGDARITITKNILQNLGLLPASLPR